MELTFRPAEPTDVEQACPLIYSSGVEGFNYIFVQKGITALDFLRYAFKNGGGFFGYKNHTVAVFDKRVVGVGVFYSGNEYNDLAIGTGKQIIKFYGLIKCVTVIRKSFHIRSIMPPPSRHTEYCAHLGVEKNMRSKGVGSALLTRQIEIAKSKKRRVFALDVAVTNPRAQKLYERLGLKVTRENKFKSPIDPNAVPDARRMELSL